MNFNERKIAHINKCVWVAKQFIERSKLAIKALDEGAYTSKEFAALKRTSMDLSRLLSELRKPNL